MPTISRTIRPAFPDCLFVSAPVEVGPPMVDTVGVTMTVGVGVSPWTVREALACNTGGAPASAAEYALIVTLLPTMLLLNVSGTENEPSGPSVAPGSVSGVPPDDSVILIVVPLE